MIIRLLYIAAVVLFLGTSSCMSVDTAFGFERPNISRAAREIRDVAVIDFTRIGMESGKPHAEGGWVFAYIKPSAKSGRIDGLQRDPTSGKWVLPPNSTISRTFEGNFESIFNFSEKNGKKSWPYRWEQPGQFNGQLVAFLGGSNSPYLPFEKYKQPVLVICKVNRDTSDVRTKFRPLWLLPEEWRGFVVPAYEILGGDVGSEMPLGKEGEKTSLQNENPLIAIDAFRRLVISGDLDTGQMAVAEGWRKSTFTYLALCYTWGRNSAAVKTALTKMIRQAKTVDELYDVALGVYAAYSDAFAFRPGRRRPSASATQTAILDLMQEVQKKLVDFGESDRVEIIKTILRASVPARWTG